MTVPDTPADDSEETDEPNAQYQDLWFHKTINANDKNPLEPWSEDKGYAGADPADLQKVYSYEQARDMDHQHFAVNGVKDAPDGTPRSLLIFDLDVHKAPDDFDPDSVRPPSDTLIVRSQSGGFHVYFIVEEPRAAASISDFTISDHVPFDIDIRGSYVKHHVIAPADFPGFGGQYEIVNDEPILTVTDPRDAAERLYVNAEHAVRYTPERETPAVNIDIDRDAEPPDEMPHCYHQGLLLRAACPDDPNLNTHRVNTLTALCGLHHGYSVDDMVDHLCEQFPPAEYNDRSKTRYHLEKLEQKVERQNYDPPAVPTLKAAGILDADDTCKCDINTHGGRSISRPTFEYVADGSGDHPDPDADADEDDGIPKPTGIEVKYGGYGYTKHTDERSEWVEWSNFQIEVESFLTMPDETERVTLTIHPRNADPYRVTVKPTVFNDERQFKNEVATGRTATFTGGKSALADIKQFVGHQDAQEQRGRQHMGRTDDSLVVPGGSLTADGWNDEHDSAYVERSLGIERKLTIGEDSVESVENNDSTEDVKSILELLPQTRENDRFLPVIGWFYATPLRPFIMDITGEFPVLSITGNTGAGKTSTLEAMWELFGVGGDPFSANDTSFTAMTTVSATDTFPVWFDEYKPTDMNQGRVAGFHDLIRKSTRGGVVAKGNPDQTTTEYHLRAPVVISGEQRFAGPAEQRRSILSTFRETATDPDGEYAEAFAELTGGSYRTDDGEVTHYDGKDLTAHAITYHQWLLAYDSEQIREAWYTAQGKTLELLDQYGVGDIDSAGRTALQTVLFGIGLYRSFANDMDATVPFDTDERDRSMLYIAKQQGSGAQRESHLDEFVELLSLAAMDNELEEDRQYTRIYDGTMNAEIRVNMARAYPKVSKYVHNHGLDSTTELLDEDDYRERLKDAVEDDDSYVTTYSQPSEPVARCFGIDIHQASEELDGFDDDSFYGRDEQGSNGRYDSDEDHWRYGG